jgi:23S rRNA (adenine2503-C2)-methyltransferase
MERIEQFISILGEYGASATVRVRRGIDIDAGCGQLKSNVIKQSSIKIADTIDSI